MRNELTVDYIRKISLIELGELLPTTLRCSESFRLTERFSQLHSLKELDLLPFSKTFILSTEEFDPLELLSRSLG